MSQTKLALGCAQFGMDYGINNTRGQVPRDEVFDLLDHAQELGIDLLDTATAYGESETVLGRFPGIKKFKIVSKLSNKNLAEVSLNNLGIRSVYGFLLHDFNIYRNDPHIWDQMLELKSEGKTEKVGFSLYYPAEVDLLLEKRTKFDFLQVPYNVFDQRFRPYFSLLKARGVEMHVRSVFLQGLVFKQPDQLNAFFAPIKDKLEKLITISRETSTSLVDLCLGFALMQEKIDRVVVGIDSRRNLEEILNVESRKAEKVADQLNELKEENEAVLLPFNWEGMK